MPIEIYESTQSSSPSYSAITASLAALLVLANTNPLAYRAAESGTENVPRATGLFSAASADTATLELITRAVPVGSSLAAAVLKIAREMEAHSKPLDQETARVLDESKWELYL